MRQFFGFFSVFLLLAVPVVSNAQSGAGVGISPATIEQSVNPGDTIVEQVSFTNLSSTQQTYYLFTRDISGVQNGGVPIFADEDAEKTGFEMSEWISLDIEELVIPGGSERTVEVSVVVPENATPGSHFAAIFASVEPPKMRSIGASVGYDVANIISIRVAGDAFEEAFIRSFATENYIYQETDVTFKSIIENKGSVLVRPVGPLEITNMFGKQVALITFNDSQAGVFPFTSRDFSVEWKSEDIGFGKYEALLSLSYGDIGAKKTITSTASFWVLPMNIIAPAVISLLVLLLAIYVGIKLYIRRAVRRAGLLNRNKLRKNKNQGTPIFLIMLIVMLAVTALFLIILLALFA